MAEPDRTVKRFWKIVSLEQGSFGHGLRLDGKTVHTPQRNELVLPTLALAEAVAAEWDAVDGDIDPAKMPMTGFANAAIDKIKPDRDAFVDAIAAYGETDAFCYRADAEDALSERQALIWDPWLDWARARYDVSFTIVNGIMHQPQPEATLAALKIAVAARGTFELAAMTKLAHLSGSLVAVLALVERAGDAVALWRACCLEELWQEELWGEDHWAQKNRLDREVEFMAAAHFLDLLHI